LREFSFTPTGFASTRMKMIAKVADSSPSNSLTQICLLISIYLEQSIDR